MWGINVFSVIFGGTRWNDLSVATELVQRVGMINPEALHTRTAGTRQSQIAEPKTAFFDQTINLCPTKPQRRILRQGLRG